MFISSESRQRAQVVESAIATTHEILENVPEVQQALGPEFTAYSLGTLDNMFIPNFRHGQVSVPRSLRDTEAIPIIAVNPGQAVVAGAGLGFTPIQKQRAFEQIKGLGYKGSDMSRLRGLVEYFDGYVQNDEGSVLAVPAAGIAGFVTRAVATQTFAADEFRNLGKNPIRATFGRPIVGLVMHPDNPIAELGTPITMMHEMQHVTQGLRSPIKPASQIDTASDDTLRMELEAYHVGATVERALYRSSHERYRGNRQLLMNTAVDNIRDAHAPAKDAFAPRGVIKKYLLELGVDL
jgi:hypothetical protein